MTTGLLLLVLAYLGLAGITVLMFLYSRAPMLLKLLVLVLLPVFYIQSWHGWKEAQGWPSHSEIPDKFLLNGVVIEEPDETTANPGRILVWLTDLSENVPDDLPRSYQTSYDRELHSSLEDAMRNMRNGHIQLGTRVSDDGSKTPPKDFSRLGEQRYKLEFDNIPDPALPEK